MIQLCQVGTGRMGLTHAENISRNPRCRLRYIVDADEATAEKVAHRFGARCADLEAAFGDPDVDGFVIVTPTETHADLIEASCRAGKPVFCEKPIDLNLDRAKQVSAVVTETGVKVVIGFNRRFDPSYEQAHRLVRDGRVGDVELVVITGRDWPAPSIDYIRTSGGIFRDLTIHDFDMARWLLGEEPVEVFATGSCLVDKRIGEVGDIDTALVTLKTASGALCQINNSRRAVYGYDQRIEVFGSEGMVRARNQSPTSVEVLDEKGRLSDKLLRSFSERFAEGYRREIDHFLDCVEGKSNPLAGVDDGCRALILADAAAKSLDAGVPVMLGQA